MAGLSVLDYFKTFFLRVVIEGETNYGKLLPHTIGLHAKNYQTPKGTLTQPSLE